MTNFSRLFIGVRFSAWKHLSAFSWLLYPHRKVVVKGRCEREKTDKEESPVLFPAYPPPTQRKLQHQSCSGKLWNKGSSPVMGYVALTSPEPLRHCTACLWVRPHILTPFTCRSRSPEKKTNIKSHGFWGYRKDSPGRPLFSAPLCNLNEGQETELWGALLGPEGQHCSEHLHTPVTEKSSNIGSQSDWAIPVPPHPFSCFAVKLFLKVFSSHYGVISSSRTFFFFFKKGQGDVFDARDIGILGELK